MGRTVFRVLALLGLLGIAVLYWAPPTVTYSDIPEAAEGSTITCRSVGVAFPGDRAPQLGHDLEDFDQIASEWAEVEAEDYPDTPGVSYEQQLRDEAEATIVADCAAAREARTVQILLLGLATATAILVVTLRQWPPAAPVPDSVPDSVPDTTPDR